jgi:hypothetical protein
MLAMCISTKLLLTANSSYCSIIASSYSTCDDYRLPDHDVHVLRTVIICTPSHRHCLYVDCQSVIHVECITAIAMLQ